MGGCVGWMLGSIVGLCDVGYIVVGFDVGYIDGDFDFGDMVGDFDVGDMVGDFDVGDLVGGFDVGEVVGDIDVGDMVGDFDVGDIVGDFDVGDDVTGSFVTGMGVGDAVGESRGELGAGAAGQGVPNGSNSTTRKMGGSPLPVDLVPGMAPESRYPTTVAE